MTTKKNDMDELVYDQLLSIFISKDDLRPQLNQPNLSDDKVYSSDGKSMIVVPVKNLIGNYVTHKDAPNYEVVMGYIKRHDPIVYAAKDLSEVLSKTPMELDVTVCETCEGEGQCLHCGASCLDCDGSGKIEDESLPLIHTDVKVAIMIGKQLLSPRQLGRVEKVLKYCNTDSFLVVGESDVSTLIRILDVEILIAKLIQENCELTETTTFELKPIQ